MRQLRLCGALMILVASSACAGVGLPFTDYRLGRALIESSHKETNSTCTDLETLSSVASHLEAQHLSYIRTKDEELAIRSKALESSLGVTCQTRFVRLSIPQIKTELFGDIQTIQDSAQLRELGGLAFEYQNVSTLSGIYLTLHLGHATSGPKRRLVAIYRLEDDVIIHYGYSGTNNVDRKSRSWPIREFFGAMVGVAVQLAIP